MEVEICGFFGLLLLIADVWVIVNIVGSGQSTLTKVVWVVIIILLPLLGFIVWLIFGPRSATP